jgi:hypothetical protein
MNECYTHCLLLYVYEVIVKKRRKKVHENINNNKVRKCVEKIRYHMKETKKRILPVFSKHNIRVCSLSNV